MYVVRLSSHQRPLADCHTLTAHSRIPHSIPLHAYRSRPSLVSRDLPPHIQALAILLPKRNYATETATHGTGGGPPPGFNINEAMKPLPKDDGKKTDSIPPAAQLKPGEEGTVPEGGATAVDKTKGQENASLTELAAEKATETKAENKSIAIKKEEDKKLTIGQKIKKELVHYWDGTKLLAAEVKISTKLALKMAAGYELSRRENRQVSTVLLEPLLYHRLLICPSAASTNRARPRTSGPVLCFRHCPVCRTPPAGGAQALPQPLAVDV